MKKFQKSWGFIATVFFISLLLIAFSCADEAVIASPNIKAALRIAGQTILSSAVFLGVVKTLQYTDYFKDEINEVVYTDKYLQTLSLDALKKKWIMLSNVIHSSKFPSLKDNLNTHVLDKIISATKNYTHSRMRLIYTIEPIGTDKQFFRLVEQVNMVVNAQKGHGIEFILSTNLVKEDSDDDISDLKVTKLVIENVELKDLPKVTVERIERGQQMLKFDYKHPPINKESIQIIKELETIHSTKLNAYWQMDFDTFVEDTREITLNYDQAVFEVDVIAIGQTIRLVKDPLINSTQTVKFQCPDLIFQKDCLILIIKYK